MTPTEPDEPTERPDDADADWDYVEFLRQEQPEIRPATYADKDECFFVRQGDGSDVAMALEFKSYRRPSPSGNMPFTDQFANAIRNSLLATEPRKSSRRARVSPQKLTGLAAFIAGRQRATVGSEWRAHLSGETGTGLPEGRQLQEAAGFVLAAVRYRLQDAADLAWRPVDTVLGSHELSNLVVLLATLGMSVVFLRSGGFYNLCVNFQSVAAVWVAAYGLIRAGRWGRGVKPPKHKPRRRRR